MHHMLECTGILCTMHHMLLEGVFLIVLHVCLIYYYYYIQHPSMFAYIWHLLIGPRVTNMVILNIMDPY